MTLYDRALTKDINRCGVGLDSSAPLPIGQKSDSDQDKTSK
jgi:hypothetical protein